MKRKRKKSRLNNAQDPQFNGLKFLQESSKKITHLFSAHMPQLTRIAHSTVLRMQICFAWKSIWSCLKEARTALLLSPPRRLARGSLLPSISSRVENIFTSSVHTNMRSVASPRLRQLPQHRGPICRSRGPELAALSASGTRGPSTVCTVGLYMQRTGTRNNYPLCGEATDFVLMSSPPLLQKCEGAVPTCHLICKANKCAELEIN